jgi:hypothetical protein
MQREELLGLAELFLQEAVYRSRATQAAGTALAQLSSGVERQCGLGDGPAVVLDLTARGRELAAQLFPTAVPEHVAPLLRAWVERQDALDRDRNHFLKAFRHAHGFDRRAWSAGLLAEYESGLAAIAAREDEARAIAARRL